MKPIVKDEQLLSFSASDNNMTAAIDALLPQTQCGLCGYKGCLPYAQAIVTQAETINKCLPGGVATLNQLAISTQQDPTPWLAEMQTKQKPTMVAKIREAECIGCTKCIQACPVDAIIGSAKLMHVIIESECSGCELCVEPCPMDCIDMQIIAPQPNHQQQMQNATQYRQRFYARNERLSHEKQKPKQPIQMIQDQALLAKKAYVEAAIKRAQRKRQDTKVKNSHE